MSRIGEEKMTIKMTFEPFDNNQDKNNKIVVVPNNENEEVEEIEKIVEENINPFNNLMNKIVFKRPEEVTDAFVRNEEADPSTAIITTACGVDGSNNVCAFKDDCKILKEYDDIIYKRLKENEVIAIEVRWCGEYEPRNKFTNIEAYRESVDRKIKNNKIFKGGD